MNNNAIVSIIIACYNAEKYIKNCLDSIKQSIFTNYEVIVIDDCSTDKTKTILQKYRDNKKIKIYFLKKNAGPAKSRNFGVTKSHGEYIFFLDADTKIEKNTLKEVIQLFESRKDIGAFQTQLIRPLDQTLETSGHFLTFFGFPYEINTDKFIPIFGSRTASMAVRKTVFQEVAGFDEDYIIYGEDTDLSWRIWLAGYKIYFCPLIKVYHCQKSTLNNNTGYRVFYEGTKNNTSNILKNASFAMIFWMLPLHLLGWFIIFLKLLIQRRPIYSLYVLKGILWNFIFIHKTLAKRKVIKRNRDLSFFILGHLSLHNLLTKGWKWFWRV